MSLCASCEDIGLVPFVAFGVSKPDADITSEDLAFAVCLCDAGQGLRVTKNEKAATVPRWRIWCAREQIDPSRVCLVEEAFDQGELIAAGLVGERRSVDRASALLAAGRRKR